MKEKLKKLLFDEPSNIFVLIANITINIAWVFLLGLFICKSLVNTTTIITVWSISLLMGKAKHYSSPLKCFLMQLIMFSLLYLLTYIDIYIAIFFTVYAKYLFSGHSDIKDDETEGTNPKISDFTLWKAQNESVHQPLINYLKYNAITDEYLEAEKLLKKKVDTRTYLIYKRKFIDGYSYEKITEEFDISSPRIKECLDKCYYFLIGRLNI